MKEGYERRGSAAKVMKPERVVEGPEDALMHAKMVIATRAIEHMDKIPHHIWKNRGINTVYLCGGALLPGEPSDLDFFCVREASAPLVENIPGNGTHPPIQIISTSKKCLGDVVEGFDFAHCKVGAVLKYQVAPYSSFVEAVVERDWTCPDVYISPEFMAARIAGNTFYTLKDDRPARPKMRSLVRVTKVAKKLGLNNDEAFKLALQVTGDVGTEDEL
jgi:hypothetical protein